MSSEPAGADFTETRIDGECVFEGTLLHVRRDVVRLPNGRDATREYIVHPGAVAIVPLLDNGEVVLERQYRYAIGRELIEIPAGKIDPGESPLETGRRELREETGYVAGQWEPLYTFYPLVAYSTERIDIFLARDLRREAASLDDGEFLEVFSLPLATALDWVEKGRIVDAKTMLALFTLDRRLRHA